MRQVFPGRPEASPYALSTGSWGDRSIAIYISNFSIIALNGPNRIIQTINVSTEKPLKAVCFDQDTGQIAASAGPDAFIYRLETDKDSKPSWIFQCRLELKDRTDNIETVSWGRGYELLVGGASLNLFNTTPELEELIWSYPLANPVKFADFSPDYHLIVTTGVYDQFLKVWRRLGLGPSDQQFEFSYLPHKNPITSIYWRRWKLENGRVNTNVLYTLSTDNYLRIWANIEGQRRPSLQKWAQIDLTASLKAHSPTALTALRNMHAFIIDHQDLISSVKTVYPQLRGHEGDQTIAQLKEATNFSPDVCVIMDSDGNITVWGFTNIGLSSKTNYDIFNIAHIEKSNLRLKKRDSTDEIANITISAFPDRHRRENLVLLVNYFGDRIEWHECRIDKILTSAFYPQLFSLRAVWTGHASPAKKVVRTCSGKAVISRTKENDAIMWSLLPKDGSVSYKSRVGNKKHVHRICVLREGDFVVFLHKTSVSLWDCRTKRAKLVSELEFTPTGKPLSFLLIPEATGESGPVHIATICSDLKGLSWRVNLPSLSDGVDGHAGLEEFVDFVLEDDSTDLAYILPVDPAGSVLEVPGVFDSSVRDVALSYSSSGVVKTWSAKVDVDKRSIEWFNTATVETFITNPGLASGTSIRKVALINTDRNELTIWNTRSSQLEFRQQFGGDDKVNDIDWSWTPDGQSILSIGFSHKILIYSQLRYDYLDKGPAWAVMKEINTLSISPNPVSDSVWISNGRLFISAGSQVLVEGNKVDGKHVDLEAHRLATKGRPFTDIHTLVQRLNGPLPIFHPQFLSQCVLAGKFDLLNRVLIRLYSLLKTPKTSDLDCGSLLGLDSCEIWKSSDTTRRSNYSQSYQTYPTSNGQHPKVVDEDIAKELAELLEKIDINLLSSKEQGHLVHLVQCVGLLDTYRRSLDDHACRYWVYFRQHTLHTKDQQRAETVPVSWREITWAFHSESQDVILDLLDDNYKGSLAWENAKECGLFLWLHNPALLRQQMEKVAKSEFIGQDGQRDPVRCSIFYLALKKKHILASLWKAAYGNPEQAATSRLLANDFEEERWKDVAVKNAYALMGRHRDVYAAAFFLLAGRLDNAASVLIDRADNLLLALAVARVWEDGLGPVTRSILNHHVLPRAATLGNRWMASWAFWLLGQRDMAIRALIDPLPSLVKLWDAPGKDSKLFLADDPALLVLYRDIRGRSLHALSGTIAVQCRGEAAFVCQTAELYNRMGCDWLGLDLVANWDFLQLPSECYSEQGRADSLVVDDAEESVSVVSPTVISPSQAKNLLRRRSSLVIDDIPPGLVPSLAAGKASGKGHENSSDGQPEGMRASRESAEKSAASKQEPTMFVEPDPNDLLDDFGF